MAGWHEVDAAATALPGVAEQGGRDRCWKVNNKLLVWERPLRKGDLEHLGDKAPEGDVVAIMVKDEGLKHALIADEPDVFFTTPHFHGYPAVLAVLERLDADELAELVTEAWLDRAPRRAVKEFLAARPAT
jgi:hypothetical protein